MSELDRILGQRRTNSRDVREAISEVIELDEYCQALVRAAYSDGDTDDEWERVFDAVFEGGVSRRVIRLSETIGPHFDWSDPDTTYEEDACAFINALHEYARDL